jgi:diguanylate cyclase (GGDEF)-like protein
VFIDIDHFKNYNDTHGHLTGDDLLKSLADILQEQSRGSTEIVRYGGEEFLLLVPETGREGACVFAERLRRAVEEHPFPGRERQPGGKLTLSLGVATFPESGETGAELLDSADKALYQSKQRGRNIVSVWEHSLA